MKQIKAPLIPEITTKANRLLSIISPNNILKRRRKRWAANTIITLIIIWKERSESGEILISNHWVLLRLRIY
jgi:hypothetical protein